MNRWIVERMDGRMDLGCVAGRMDRGNSMQYFVLESF